MLEERKTLESGTRAFFSRFTWGEWIERATSAPMPGRCGMSSGDNFTPPSNHWDLGHGFQGTVKRALHGWDEGERAVKTISKALFDKIAVKVEREFPVYDVEGCEIDVARFLDNEPECWQRFESEVLENAGRRIIKLVLNISASASVSASTLMAKGAAMTALAELLEFAGHGVEVVVTDGSRGGWGVTGMQAFNMITIKHADQPMDINRMAVAMAHPGMLRRLGFSIMEHWPLDVQRAIGVGGGYGHPADPPKDEQGDVYIGRSYYGEPQWESVPATIRWVLDQLKAQGIVIKEEV